MWPISTASTGHSAGATDSSMTPQPHSQLYSPAASCSAKRSLTSPCPRSSRVAAIRPAVTPSRIHGAMMVSSKEPSPPSSQMIATSIFIAAASSRPRGQKLRCTYRYGSASSSVCRSSITSAGAASCTSFFCHCWTQVEGCSMAADWSNARLKLCPVASW
ncbi:hypothetical protein D3C79_843890 [compost metagenome]